MVFSFVKRPAERAVVDEVGSCRLDVDPHARAHQMMEP
jgi:hypothetical protein